MHGALPFFNENSLSLQVKTFHHIMEERINPYRRAAENGIPFGAYLSAMAVGSIFADRMPLLALAVLVMMVATPVVVYRFQRRYFIDEQGFTEFAALWMMGIMMFVFGSLIAGLVTYLTATMARPDFIYDQANQVIATYSQLPEFKDSEMVSVLQKMVDEGMLPSPIETVFNMFWAMTFGGAILSAVTALVAQRRINSIR